MKWRFLVILGALALAMVPAIAFADGPVNPGFETGDLTGWQTGTVVDSVGVVGPDGFATPYHGNYMARLGTPRFVGQPIGPNELYQEFEAGDALNLAYNLNTYDYYDYDGMSYKLTDIASGAILASWSQTAWGPAGDITLKSTGWQTIAVNTSGYKGKTLRLLFDAGGTRDTLFGTWCYIDGIPVLLPPPPPESMVRFNWNVGPGQVVVIYEKGTSNVVWKGRREYKEAPFTSLVAGKAYDVYLWGEKTGLIYQGTFQINPKATGHQEIWFPLSNNVFPWGRVTAAK